MHSFEVQDVGGNGGLEFCERLPEDVSSPLNGFSVRLVGNNLSASVFAYIESDWGSPADLFSAMSVNWQGWKDDMNWCSMAGELSFFCRHDRRGHVALEVEMHTFDPHKRWSLKATVMTEAGQLERIARQARHFFDSLTS